MLRNFLISVFLWTVLCSGIKSPEFTIKSYPELDALAAKKQLRVWWTLDPVKDGVPGISLKRARNFLKKKTGKEVIVGIIGSGVDINHKDLKEHIWVNSGEIENNGKDDDQNGYVDDIHGWNFLGSTLYENLEATRVIRDFKKKFENRSIVDVAASDLNHYLAYKTAKKVYQEGLTKAIQDTISINSLKRLVYHSLNIINQEMGESYTEKELLNKSTPNLEFIVNREILFNLLKEFKIPTLSEIYRLEYLFDTKPLSIQYYYNLNYYSNRSKVKAMSPGSYGNNNVTGPNRDASTTSTYLSGLIVNSGNRVPSVGQNIKIMPLRVLPNGDEYDEDVAFAIRYAVDNGAKVIALYFRKPISPERQLVEEAIKYAQDKDVILVMPTGNEHLNEDHADYKNFPKDYDDSEKEFVNNLITVGSTGFLKNILIEDSNYGAKHVDIFAPGEVVFSLIEDDQYGMQGEGPLASAAITAGVAAVIRSYYPKLSASTVKNIIMESGVKSDLEIQLLSEDSKIPFSKLSKSGKIINLYRALLFSEKNMSN